MASPSLSLLSENASASAASRGVESEANVQSGNGLDLLLGQVERGGLEVLLESLDAVGLGDDDDVALCAPSEQDLAGGDAVLLGGSLDGVDLEQRLDLLGLGVVQLNERGRAKGGVAGDGNVVLLSHGDELGLGEVRVVLDLEDGRGDLGVRQQIVDQLGVEVGDTNGLEDALGVLGGLDELLQGAPGLRDGDLGQGGGLGLLLVGPEAGPSQLLKGNELESNGEVDEEEVEVVETPGLKLELGLLVGVLALVVVVPELGGDKELLSLHEALLNGAADTLTGLGAVGVVPGTIEVTVSKLDGVVDSLGTGLTGDLPDTESDDGHLLE